MQPLFEKVFIGTGIEPEVSPHSNKNLLNRKRSSPVCVVSLADADAPHHIGGVGPVPQVLGDDVAPHGEADHDELCGGVRVEVAPNHHAQRRGVAWWETLQFLCVNQ